MDEELDFLLLYALFDDCTHHLCSMLCIRYIFRKLSFCILDSNDASNFASIRARFTVPEDTVPTLAWAWLLSLIFLNSSTLSPLRFKFFHFALSDSIICPQRKHSGCNITQSWKKLNQFNIYFGKKYICMYLYIHRLYSLVINYLIQNFEKS